MKIENIEFFYLSMPEVNNSVDGSQDALLVRVTSGDHVGYGECEASPLTSISAYVCPLSHGACRPVKDTVLGEIIEKPEDIHRLRNKLHLNSMDLLQAPHTFSGIEMALWDLMGKKYNEPVWSLLGYKEVFPKLAYFSVLFGDNPDITYMRARDANKLGFKAVKFGWGPIGKLNSKTDAEHFIAAREGFGEENYVMVDVGQIFIDDVEKASERVDILEKINATWLEEPFHAYEYDSFKNLKSKCKRLRIASGEGCHNTYMAKNLIKYGQIDFVQIDCGRIGGIGPAKEIVDFAIKNNVTYVNHTFTSHLALSASMQPFSGVEDFFISEYPGNPMKLATEITVNSIDKDKNGYIKIPDGPGLGVDINLPSLKKYLRNVEISIDSNTIFQSSEL